MADDADVIVVGAGLAGLVAATELADAGKRVIVARPGGRAEPRRPGVLVVRRIVPGRLAPSSAGSASRTPTTSRCRTGWASAGFDRDEDHWPKRWAEAYVAFAAGEKRDWLRAMGHRIFPVVGWAERGGYDAIGHGNSVPRFHVTWGTGPGIVEPFVRRAREAERSGHMHLQVPPSRRRADRSTNGAIDGVPGAILEPDDGGARRRSRHAP